MPFENKPSLLCDCVLRVGLTALSTEDFGSELVFLYTYRLNSPCLVVKNTYCGARYGTLRNLISWERVYHPRHVHTRLVSLSLPSDGYRGLYRKEKSGRSVKPGTDLHWVPKLATRWSTYIAHPPPHCMELMHEGCLTTHIPPRWARGSGVVQALCYKPEGRGIASRWDGFFLIYLILPAALWPWCRLTL
jgi:hypothetical protein